MSQSGKLSQGITPGSVVETLTGNTGGAVSPSGSGNINVVGDTTTISVAGNPGANTLTISAAGGIATTYRADIASATPSGGILYLAGGTNITSSGIGNTINYGLTGIVAIANGGTNASSFANTFGVVYFDGTRLVDTTVGTSGDVLTSNGSGVAPTFQAAASGVTSITGNSGPAQTGSITLTGGSTGALFAGLTGTITMTFAGITANNGVVNLGTDNAANAINIGLGSTARNIHVGDSAAAHVVSIGSTTGAASLTQRVGTGNFSLDGVTSSTYSIGSSTTTGTISIGGSAQTGSITLGSSSGTNTVNIGSGSGLGTINIGTGATNAKTIHIGDGAVANIVTVGSTTGAASLTLNSGSAGIVASGVSGVVVANKNYVTINTSTGALGSDAGPAAGITWNNVTGTSASMSVNNGYIANNASLVTLTMPSTAVVGSVIEVVGNGSGGWIVAQNSGQTVHFGNVNTTTGVAGALSSLNRYDSFQLVCTVANTDFVVKASMGNITYV